MTSYNFYRWEFVFNLECFTNFAALKIMDKKHAENFSENVQPISVLKCGTQGVVHYVIS